MLQRLVATCGLAFPEVGFRLESRGSVVLELPPAVDPLERVVQIHGAEFADKLLAIERHDLRIHVAGGSVSPSSRGRGPSTRRSWSIGAGSTPWVAAALRQAFGDLLAPNRHPFAIVSLGIDPARIDINVHPTKREIRFLDESLLFGELLRAAREQTERLVPTWNLDPQDQAAARFVMTVLVRRSWCFRMDPVDLPKMDGRPSLDSSVLHR
ncbi:MAG: hypothetical protein R3E12_10455 [Candidatus Eisenbacteria bacterium]